MDQIPPGLERSLQEFGQDQPPGLVQPDEYKQLYEATRERAADPPKPRWTWECEQLQDFVLFMVNTGLRPDEAGRLQFRDVEIVQDAATNETILEISIRGKRGVGYCKSMPGAVEPFRRLKMRKRLPHRPRKDSWGGTAETAKSLVLPKPTDLLFPDLRAHHLNAVLDEEKLKFDREGLRRSAYSLRHTYYLSKAYGGCRHLPDRQELPDLG
jgi:integrase